MSSPLALAFAFAALALTEPTSGTASANAVATVTVEGQVREVAAGPAGRPRATLATDDGRTLVLRGRSASEDGELRRLSGVRVKLVGATGGPELGPGELRVDRYTIVDAGGGVAPRIGVIAALSLDGQRRLIFVDEAGEAELLPAGWNKKMAKQVGAKVWMVGAHADGAFQPRRFAILVPAAAVEPDGTSE